jgi:thiamine pyrophosphokinase
MEITERGAWNYRLRGKLCAFDPYHLIRVIPAEGMTIKSHLPLARVFLMINQACIFLGGVYAEREPLIALADNGLLVIGVDGGTSHIASFGLMPQVIIGDMDSLPLADFDLYLSKGARIFRHPPEKDETDFELALDYAIREGCNDILVVGALGGRTDHLIANLLLPVNYLDKARIRFVRGAEEITYINSKSVIHGIAGDVLSLLPVIGDVVGVKTTGLRYPLKSETLILGRSRGVSNVMSGVRATISVSSGILLCIHTHNLYKEAGKEIRK